MKPELQRLMQKARASLQAAELLSREGYPDFAASRAYAAEDVLSELPKRTA